MDPEMKEAIENGLKEGLAPLFKTIIDLQKTVLSLLQDVKKNKELIEVLEKDRMASNELLEINKTIFENKKKGSEYFI